MINDTLQGIVWKEGKHYVSQCLNVDVASFGKTKSEALKNLKEALALYFDDVPANQVIVVTQPELVAI